MTKCTNKFSYNMPLVAILRKSVKSFLTNESVLCRALFIIPKKISMCSNCSTVLTTIETTIIWLSHAPVAVAVRSQCNMTCHPHPLVFFVDIRESNPEGFYNKPT